MEHPKVSKKAWHCLHCNAITVGNYCVFCKNERHFIKQEEVKNTPIIKYKRKFTAPDEVKND